ncbi:MAG: hypothetical protein EXR79_15645 [Myxococcales bacterium]|nr:hypothetical protein [Myxococcales bacterium]
MRTKIEPSRSASRGRANHLCSWVLAFALGLTCGWLLSSAARAADRSRSTRAAEVPGVISHRAPSPAVPPALLSKPHVEDVVAAARARGDLFEAAVRVEDLDTGIGYTLGGHVAFNPASILKLLVLSAVLERDAREPGFLTSSVRWTLADTAARESTSDAWALQSGASYRVDDLCRRMIVRSRNDAKALLSQAVGDAALEAAYVSSGLAEARHAPGDIQAHVEEVAASLRRLVRPGALPEPHQQQAMAWLQASEFRLGIAAGAPAGATVASKFGRRRPAGPNGRLQLHDCGVVDAAGARRLVCVMTRGATDAGLQRTIADVTRAVFQPE